MCSTSQFVILIVICVYPIQHLSNLKVQLLLISFNSKNCWFNTNCTKYNADRLVSKDLEFLRYLPQWEKSCGRLL